MATKRKKAWLDVIKALTVKMKHIDHLSWKEELHDPIGREGQWGGLSPDARRHASAICPAHQDPACRLRLAEPMAPSLRMTCAAVAEKKKTNTEKIFKG